MERLPRVVPFWMMLLGIVGFFILGVLYFDVRGREAKNANTNEVDVRVENIEPQPESPETTPEEKPPPLSLPSETLSSEQPAAFALDCVRFGYRDDRVIVADRYIHPATRKAVAVDEKTIHLRCQRTHNIIRTPRGRVFFVSDSPSWPRDNFDVSLPNSITPWTLFEINPQTGILTEIVKLPEAQDASDMFFETDVNDDGSLIVGRLNLRSQENLLLQIETKTGEVNQTVLTPQSVNTVHFTQDKRRAFGIEWSCAEGGDCLESLYLHRYNLETQRRVRVGDLFDASRNIHSLILDDDRLVIPGATGGVFVVNPTSGARADIRSITSSIDFLGLTVDGSAIVVTGPNQPFTVIPVSELPKP